ncbi:MAG: hypothetical protein ACXVFN_11930 [Solirubrobacteraceae bacterium]
MTASARPARTGRSVVLTSVSQAMAMGTGGVLAVLIAARFGGSARTDGFFAAYGVYGLILLLAQSTRLTVVPRLVGGATTFERFDRFVAALAVLWVATGIAFIPLGGLLADAITSTSAAQTTARTAFIVLWPAAGAQLIAALGAAMLGVLGRYTGAAASYVAGSLCSVAAFLVLAGPLGVDAVAPALLAGSVVVAAPIVAGLVRSGWRPRPRASAPGVWPRTWIVLMGAASLALPQLLYVLAMAAAGHLGPGAPTTFSYGFFGSQVFVSMLAGSLSIVLAAPLAATWDRDPRSLAVPVSNAFRLSLLILGPSLAAIVLVGRQVAAPILAGFTAAQIDSAIHALLALSPMILAAQATSIGLVALYALHRHAAIVVVALGATVLQAVLCVLAVPVHRITAIAGATSISAVVFAAGLYLLLYGGAGAVTEGGRRLLDLVRIGVPAAACFALAALISPSRWVDLVLGLALYAVYVALALRPERELLAGFVHRRPAPAVD